MPHYEYKCQECKESIEIFQKINEDPIKNCPKCGKNALTRGPGGGVGLIFQGSGFYITDYGTPAPSTEPSALPKSTCCPCGKNSSCSSK